MTVARPQETRIPLANAPAPGHMQMIELGAHRIALFSVGGRFYALADRCPHRGAPLCSRGDVVTAVEVRGGKLVTGLAHSLIRCPWHKWDYDIATGRCAVHPRLRVRRYPVRSEGDELVVSLERKTD